jgi:hypothetical protein
MTKTIAKSYFKLDEDDIASLPHQVEDRPPHKPVHYKPAQLYACDQLLDLAKRKCAKLGTELVLGDLEVHHSHSGSSKTGEVSIVSFRNPPKLSAWQEHMLNPSPPPLKIQEYTCPASAVKPDPENIVWTPSHLSGSVSVGDACRLYCVCHGPFSTAVELTTLVDWARRYQRSCGTLPLD